ncbi:MAG: hypothetical protein QG574_168 [Cyanobacteriota bacterium erpe_2018_sw_21hr_WHONDRS-SW48-000092_B_bin.40]|jgi:hypothetical protein|nr:hypothetical protein [Cyanobacteriota bacterium erpe_2018_sw_21hr_WHONDRS-SW48-000092_B_bin.40]
MQTRQLTIAFWLATCGLFLFEASVCAKSAPPKAYVLTQNIQNFGRQTIYISDQAIKVEQPGGLRTTLVKAPDWRALVINHDSHTYFQTDSKASALVMQRMMHMATSDLDKVKWTPVEESTIAGIRACRYVDSRLAKNWRLTRHGFEEMDDSMRINGFWAAKDAIVSSEAANQLAGMHGMPKIGRVPLRFIHVTLSLLTKVVIVDTISCKQISTKLAELNLPANYKRSRGEFDAQLKDSGLLDELIPQSAKRDKL